MELSDLVKKYTYEDSKFIDIYGIRIHYLDRGEGEVVLLLHGVFSSLHTFEHWFDILSENYRVITLDLPGFGLTGPTIDNEYDMDLYIDYVHEFMIKLEVHKFNIIGNSLGGWIAWEFAVSYESKINKMILLNSAGYIHNGVFPLPFIIAQTPVLRRVFNYEIVPKVVVRRFLRQVICDQKRVNDGMVDRYYDLIHREGNLEAFSRIANSNFKQNTNALRNIKTPTLVLWGGKDAWLNSDNAECFKNDLQNVTVKLYHEVGHIPMEEIPEESARDVLFFLNK